MLPLNSVEERSDVTAKTWLWRIFLLLTAGKNTIWPIAKCGAEWPDLEVPLRIPMTKIAPSSNEWETDTKSFKGCEYYPV